jgi:hypothetical protein
MRETERRSSSSSKCARARTLEKSKFRLDFPSNPLPDARAPRPRINSFRPHDMRVSPPRSRSLPAGEVTSPASPLSHLPRLTPTASSSFWFLSSSAPRRSTACLLVWLGPRGPLPAPTSMATASVAHYGQGQPIPFWGPGAKWHKGALIHTHKLPNQYISA